MKLDFGKYQIVTDDRQFVVQERKVAGENAKEENQGQTYWTVDGYYSTLETALNSLGKRIVLENDDVQDIMRELKQLKAKIKEFTKLFELEL